MSFLIQSLWNHNSEWKMLYQPCLLPVTNYFTVWGL